MKKFNRKYLLLPVLLPIILGLCAFGMKLPNLSGFSSGKPTPRPRAVMHTPVKSCKQKIEKSAPQLLVSKTKPLDPPVFERASQEIAPSSVLESTHVSNSLSRAPPAALLS